MNYELSPSSVWSFRSDFEIVRLPQNDGRDTVTRSPGRLRVLHLATVPFRPEEGVSHAVGSLASDLVAVDSHLAADRPVGAGFVGLHELPTWHPEKLIRSRDLERVVRDVQPDVVHIHGGILVSTLALARALRGSVIVASVYQLLPPDRSEVGLRNWGDARRSSVRPGRILASGLVGLPLARRLLKSGRIAAVCTPDPRVQAALENYGPVVMARGGGTVSDLRAVWNESCTIGFAGRAEPGRGVEELVEAIEILRKDIPSARLRLMLLPGPAGEKWAAEHANNDAIEISIGVRPNLAADLAACQLVALPFRIPATITPPLVGSEAMAVGTPLVARRLSCTTPLVKHGVNGMLTEDSSAASLADAMRACLSDRKTWESMSCAALRTIDTEWSWKGAASATRGAYELALSRAQVGSPINRLSLNLVRKIEPSIQGESK